MPLRDTARRTPWWRVTADAADHSAAEEREYFAAWPSARSAARNLVAARDALAEHDNADLTEVRQLYPEDQIQEFRAERREELLIALRGREMQAYDTYHQREVAELPDHNLPPGASVNVARARAAIEGLLSGDEETARSAEDDIRRWDNEQWAAAPDEEPSIYASGGQFAEEYQRSRGDTVGHDSAGEPVRGEAGNDRTQHVDLTLAAIDEVLADGASDAPTSERVDAAMAAVRADPSVLNLITARLAVDELPGDQSAGADLDQAADWPYHAHAAADVAATYRTDPNDSDNHKTTEQLWRALCATEYRSYVVAYGNDGNPRNDLPDRWAARAADLAERLSGEVEVPPGTLRSRARDAAYAYGQDPGTDDDPDRFEPPAWANLRRHDGGAAAQEDPDETAAAVHAACAAVEQVDDAAAPPPPHNSESRESAADDASVDD